MLLSLILMGIKKAVDGFSNLCAFLLVKLGLWLPTLYCLIFLLAAAVLQIKLQGAVVGLLLGGTIACFIIGGFIALKSYGDKLKFRSGTPYSSAPKSMQRSILDYPVSRDNSNKIITSSFEYSKRDSDTLNTAAFDVPSMQVATSNESLPQDTQKKRSSTYEKLKERPYKYDDFKDLQAKYFNTKDAEPSKAPPQSIRQEPTQRADDLKRHAPLYSSWTSTKTETNRDELNDYSRHNLKEDSEIAATFNHRNDKPTPPFRAEEPMIFATRRDPNILVYEYSDRLDFYKKTRSGGLEFVERIVKR